MHIPLTKDENVALRNAAENLNDAQSARAQVIINHWRKLRRATDVRNERAQRHALCTHCLQDSTA